MLIYTVYVLLAIVLFKHRIRSKYQDSIILYSKYYKNNKYYKGIVEFIHNLDLFN